MDRAEVASSYHKAHSSQMRPPVTPDLANDNGKPEDHLAAATVALHKAVEGLEAPAELIVDVLTVEAPMDATQP
jgi:hypothetical protein